MSDPQLANSFGLAVRLRDSVTDAVCAKGQPSSPFIPSQKSLPRELIALISVSCDVDKGRALPENKVVVLVVGDEFYIREFLLTELEDAGFGVVLASSFAEGVRALEDSTTQFRALITDINLQSKRSGWDVARHARRSHAEFPVIYMTGDSGQMGC